jgi:RimJ/RimL family protein N-acetyltransferase
MNIRPITINDADNFITLLKTIDFENDFMIREPGELKVTSNEMQNDISKIEEKGHFLHVLEKDEYLYGYVKFTRSKKLRLKHKGELSIGLISEAIGKGYGKQLMLKLEQWAKGNGIERLDLKVAKNNEKALKLYKNLRFEITGEYKKDVKINEREYLDFVHMSKFL